jgi:hypothetical protein
MARTIKGGAYQEPDGSWRDANGKPLSSKQVQEFEAAQAEKEDVLTETPPPQPVTPVTDVPPAAAPVAPRRGRSKGSD